MVKVISAKNLPNTPPVNITLLCLLIHKVYNLGDIWAGVGGVILALLWSAFFVVKCFESQVDIFKELK